MVMRKQEKNTNKYGISRAKVQVIIEKLKNSKKKKISKQYLEKVIKDVCGESFEYSSVYIRGLLKLGLIEELD